MKQKFTDQELEQFAQFYEIHGAVHLPGLIEPEWVEKVTAQIESAVAAENNMQQGSGRALSFGHGKGRTTIRYQWRENPLIREFLLRQELARPIAKICRTTELRLWFDLTFIHEATAEGKAGEGSGWHHDIAAFSWKGEKLPSLWMAMTPATALNSRIEFVDGSHKTVPGFFRPPTSKPGTNDGMLDILDYDALIRSGKEKMLTWDCQPGDAILIHPYLIHGAKGNSGSKNSGHRVAMTTRWLGDDVHWMPTNLGSPPGIPGIDTHFPLGARPSGDMFPLVWSTAADETKHARS